MFFNDLEHLYLDKNGKVHEIMYNKVINRAGLLKELADGSTKQIFEANNNDHDTSFTSDNYNINISNNKLTIQQNNNVTEDDNRLFRKAYGLNIDECFELKYNKSNNQFTVPSNELNGVPIDSNKGIKVDRIFIETYIPEEYQKDYLDKLDSKLKSIHHQQTYSNIDNMQSNPNTEIRQNMIEQDLQKVPETKNTNYIINEYNIHKNDKNKQVEKQQSNHTDSIYTSIVINSELKEPDCKAKSSRNDISENNINNNDSDCHLCSCWKQCWDRCR